MTTHETPTTHTSERAWVIALGVIGVLVSWAYFIPATLEYGFFESWAAAFASHPHSVGLHWDLVLSLVIVISIALLDRRRLGTKYVVGTIAMGCVLGVCAALPVYWIGLRRSSGSEES